MFNKPKVIMHKSVRVSDNKLLKNTKSENKNIDKLQQLFLEFKNQYTGYTETFSKQLLN